MNRQRESSGHHFYLKPLTVNDLEHIAVWYEDIRDLALIESKLSVPINSSSLEKLWQNDLAHSEPATNYLFSICGQGNEPVGHTGLQEISYSNGNAVVFIYLKKDSRGRGIALRSMALILDLAFYQLRLHRITTYVHTNNTASAGLVNRLGFTKEGCMREGYFYDGQYGDLDVVGLLSREWESCRVSLSDSLEGDVAIAFGADPEGRWAWPLK